MTLYARDEGKRKYPNSEDYFYFKYEPPTVELEIWLTDQLYVEVFLDSEMPEPSIALMLIDEISDYYERFELKESFRSIEDAVWRLRVWHDLIKISQQRWQHVLRYPFDWTAGERTEDGAFHPMKVSDLAKKLYPERHTKITSGAQSYVRHHFSIIT
jgi:hypothetical protein